MIRSLSFGALLVLLASAPAAAGPVKVLFDTDMQTDCDDAGALAVLHALADNGEAEILATMVSVTNEWSAPCVEAINTYYGRPDLPIGVVKGAGVNMPSAYARQVAEEFPHHLRSGKDAPDAVGLYREILAGQPDGEVVVVTVGYMTNLKNLLNSTPDRFSPLNGRELARRKVKLWVCMGGNFPQGDGNNVNFTRDTASVVEAVRRWPGPLTFCGREIGHALRAGARLAETPAANPVRRAYQAYNGLKSHHCADLAAVLFAVRGLGDYWDAVTTGHMEIADDATFRWVPGGERQQGYLLAKKPVSEMQALLEALMVQPPKHAAR